MNGKKVRVYATTYKPPFNIVFVTSNVVLNTHTLERESRRVRYDSDKKEIMIYACESYNSNTDKSTHKLKVIKYYDVPIETLKKLIYKRRDYVYQWWKEYQEVGEVCTPHIKSGSRKIPKNIRDKRDSLIEKIPRAPSLLELIMRGLR